MAVRRPPLPPDPPAEKRGENGGASSGTGTTGTTDTPRARSTGSPRPGSPGPGSKGTRAGTSRKLRESLEELFSAPALAYSIAGDAWAAEFVAGRAPVLADAWTDLAEKNPAVRRILERLTEGSAWGGVIIATGGTALPLLAHHGVLPEPLAGAFAGVPASGEPSGPIVPPPPPPAGPPPEATPSRRGRDTPVSDMTPPLKDGQPPGVVTVAGTNSRAVA